MQAEETENKQKNTTELNKEQIPKGGFVRKVEPVGAAYIHIPFCVKKCHYCDFVSFSNCGLKERDDYVEALCTEISERVRLADFRYGRLNSIYFGGGTPGLLSCAQQSKILSVLDKSIGIADDCEICLETNPHIIEKNKLLGMKTLGINRLSIGVQSFQDELLKRLGRIHTGAEAKKKIHLAQDLGFTNISADLMFGLPGQAEVMLLKDLQKMLSLDLQHIALYSLIIEEGTEFYKHYGSDYGSEEMQGEVSVSSKEVQGEASVSSEQWPALPTEESERRMYELCIEELTKNDFIHYEISNFAKKGYMSRQSLCYWNAKPYWGFGLAASSYLNNYRLQTSSELDSYLKSWLNTKSTGLNGQSTSQTEALITQSFATQSPIVQSLSIQSLDPRGLSVDTTFISVEEDMKEFFLLGFRKTAGVNLRDFYERYEQNISELCQKSLDGLVQQALLVKEGETYRLSRKGLDFANIVFREFV